MSTQGEAQKNLLVLVVITVVLLVVVFLFFQPMRIQQLTLGKEKISNLDGTYKLLEAKNIAIVMDVRGITQENKVSVFNCGTAYAQGFAGIGKNVSAFAIEDDLCVGPDTKTVSIAECDQLIHLSDYIILVKGTNNTPGYQYYSDHFLVEVPINSTFECGVKLKQTST